MAKKGSKSRRGQPETRWGETKSEQVAANVTPTGKRLFMEKVRALGMSVAELIERIGRGKITLTVIPDSLPELIDAYGIDRLATDALIPIEALEELRNGRSPTPPERLGLCRALKITPEQLQEALQQQRKEKPNGCNHH
jgi:hypothetical protein